MYINWVRRILSHPIQENCSYNILVCIFQFEVSASDGQRTSPTTFVCSIDVDRNNLQGPSFDLPSYTTTIDETHAINTLVFDLNATDPDIVVKFFCYVFYGVKICLIVI